MAQPLPKSEFNVTAQREGAGVDTVMDSAGRTALQIAVRNGDSQAATRLLQLHANPNKGDNFNRTPLYEAMGSQDIGLVKLLLANGAAFEHEDKFKCTPLIWAIEHNCSIAFLEQLHDLGLNLDVPNSANRLPLHAAAATGRSEIVDYLLQKGAEVDVTDADNVTPFHLAVEGKSLAVMQQLLERGANPLTRTKALKTPLHIAAAGGDGNVLDALLAIPAVRQSADDFKTMSEGFTPLMSAVAANNAVAVEKLLSIGADFNQRDSKDRHSLFIAAEAGHVDLVRTLIERGADVDKGAHALVHTPSITLVPMLHRLNNSGYCEMLLLFYGAGADINIRDNTGQTPLHKVCNPPDLEKLKLLLELGADPNIMDNAGRRPIDLLASALMQGWHHATVPDAIQLLLTYRADPNMSPSPAVLNSPMHCAVRGGKKDVVSLLISHNAIVDEVDRANGMTSWLISVETGKTEIGDMLLQQGANILHQDRLLKNALHYAAPAAAREPLQNFLKVPALAQFINAPDVTGQTPLHYACRAQKADCIDLLAKAGAKAEVYDATGQTPMHVAMSANSPALLTRIHTAFGNDPQIWNYKSRLEGDIPLHMAVKRGLVGLMTHLAELGSDLYARNGQGQTPMEAAVITRQESTIATMARIIKEREAKKAVPPSAGPAP